MTKILALFAVAGLLASPALAADAPVKTDARPDKVVATEARSEAKAAAEKAKAEARAAREEQEKR